MPTSFSAYRRALAQAVGLVLNRALEPSPRVARHWESTAKLEWFGGAADHHQVHLSWSFGRLRDVPPVPGQRQTVGVFQLARSTFPELDEQALRAMLEALVPREADGATRVFLQRVTAQLALADVLLTLPERVGCEVSLFARPDALDTPAPTPRWPEHARDRVAAALAAMEGELRERCERLWSAPAVELLSAVGVPPSRA
ncbi:MAG: hypothetical protein ACOZQL_07495 [Myxococcota bacterium]